MYKDVFETYNNLKELLSLKKEAIIKKDIDELARIDENIIVLSEKIDKFNLEEMKETFSPEEKQELKNLGEKIKILQENNEILIKHSINVINNILSGILNITVNEKTSYNSQGKNCVDSETLDISSITEEA